MRSLIKTVLLLIGSIIHRDKSPKVVFYHDIGTKYTPMGTNAQVFKEHMRILGLRFKVQGLRDLVCFDDGFHGLYDYRKVIRELGLGSRIPVKVFIAPRLVGQKGYLTWDEIRELQNDYGIDFQCHTWSHQTLAGPMIDESPIEERTEEWYERELVTSREKIAAELGKVVDELCFPVGYFSDELIEKCKRAGYKKVYASYPGNITDSYIQPRCLVQDLSPWAFKAVLNGGMNLFMKRYLSMHKVG